MLAHDNAPTHALHFPRRVAQVRKERPSDIAVDEERDGERDEERDEELELLRLTVDYELLCEELF